MVQSSPPGTPRWSRCIFGSEKFRVTRWWRSREGFGWAFKFEADSNLEAGRVASKGSCWKTWCCGPLSFVGWWFPWLLGRLVSQDGDTIELPGKLNWIKAWKHESHHFNGSRNFFQDLFLFYHSAAEVSKCLPFFWSTNFAPLRFHCLSIWKFPPVRHHVALSFTAKTATHTALNPPNASPPRPSQTQENNIEHPWSKTPFNQPSRT